MDFLELFCIGAGMVLGFVLIVWMSSGNRPLRRLVEWYDRKGTEFFARKLLNDEQFEIASRCNETFGKE